MLQQQSARFKNVQDFKPSTKEHESNLVVGQGAVQTVDLEALAEELGVGLAVEVQSLVDLASVEVPAVRPARQEGVVADLP